MLSHPAFRSGRLLALAASTALLAGAAPAHGGPTVQSIVGLFANDAIQRGLAAGLTVAVIGGGAPPYLAGFGEKDAVSGAPPDQNTLFLIASVTKPFTSNLLGQAVNAGTISLNQPLSSYGAVLGTLPPNSAAVTLEQLADFTGGFPFVPSKCKGHETPPQTGCVPGSGPQPITVYTAADFATFFQTYQTGAPPPQSYIYSDAAMGLTGLLLGATPGQPLDNSAFENWANLVATQITTPLGMNHTFLVVPGKDQPLEAAGYTTAVGQAAVKAGGVVSVKLSDPGSGYTTAPAVAISGGNGTGAQAIAVLSAKGSLSGIQVTNAGTGYVAPAKVFFRGGGSAGAGQAIIANGQVVGVEVGNGGNFTSTPTVAFKGGRLSGGRDATAIAHLDNGAVDYVEITDGGAGYVPPVTVSIGISPPITSVIPIWGASSALSSSSGDLAAFTAAALGNTSIGGIAVPPAITAGFQIAETPYACVSGNPSLSGCTGLETGLGWSIQPGNPEVISKDGGVPGFASFVTFIPSANIGVVVLANTRNSGGGAPPVVAQSILYALYHEGLSPGHPGK